MMPIAVSYAVINESGVKISMYQFRGFADLLCPDLRASSSLPKLDYAV